MGSWVSKLRRAAQGVRRRFRRGEPSATDKNVLLTRPAFSNDQDAIDVPPTPVEEFEHKPALGLRTDAAAGVGAAPSTAAKAGRSPNPFGDDDDGDDGPGAAGAAPKRPSVSPFSGDDAAGGVGVPSHQTGTTGVALRPALPAAFGSDDDDDDDDFVPRRRVPSQSAAAAAARRSPWDEEPDAVTVTPSAGRPEPSPNPFADGDDEAPHDSARPAATPTHADGAWRGRNALTGRLSLCSPRRRGFPRWDDRRQARNARPPRLAPTSGGCALSAWKPATVPRVSSWSCASLKSKACWSASTASRTSTSSSTCRPIPRRRPRCGRSRRCGRFFSRQRWV